MGLATRWSQARLYGALHESSSRRRPLAQLLGVRRTTVMSTMNKLREVDCIKTDRRGLLEIDRTRLENVACECYGVMRHRIKRLHNEELIGALERRHMRE